MSGVLIPFLMPVHPGAFPTHPADAAMLARDRSDAPTAALRALLAPVVVLTEDSDLIDPLLLDADWRLVVRAGRTVAGTGGTAYGGILLTVAGGRGIGVSVRALGGLARRPWGQLAVFVLVIGLAATYDRWYPRARGAWATVQASSSALVEGLGEIAAEYHVRLTAAYQVWDTAERGMPGDSLTHQAARLLAASPRPLTRTDLAALMRPNAGGAEQRHLVRQLGGVLSGCSAFAEIARGKWQLGRAGADFGFAESIEQD